MGYAAESTGHRAHSGRDQSWIYRGRWADDLVWLMSPEKVCSFKWIVVMLSRLR